MNPLTTLSPAARKIVYTVGAWLGLALAATQVGFAAASAGQPTALTVALAVYAFVGGALGLTARANVAPNTGWGGTRG